MRQIRLEQALRFLETLQSLDLLLSVGENYNDDKSLYLGDFQIKQPKGEKKVQ